MTARAEALPGAHDANSEEPTARGRQAISGLAAGQFAISGLAAGYFCALKPSAMPHRGLPRAPGHVFGASGALKFIEFGDPDAQTTPHPFQSHLEPLEYEFDRA